MGWGTRANGGGGRKLQQSSSEGDVATPSEGSPAFRCLECLNSFRTWTKLTNHLEQSSHFLAKCAVCGEKMKCYGPNQPHRHEVSTGHRGFLGVFYTREDYKIDHPPFLSRNQYRCVCRVTFTESLHIALHLREDHGITSIPDRAKCLTCNVEGTLAELVQHKLNRLSENKLDEIEVLGFAASRYLMPCPSRAPYQAKGEDYTILYQCPPCRLLFASWSLLQTHMKVTSHDHGFIPFSSVAVLHVCGLNGTGYVEFSQKELETLVNINDPEMSALIQHAVPNTCDTENDVVIGHQCPKESCSSLFLTHGELFEHMENEGHYPAEENAKTDIPPPEVPLWSSDTAAYEVRTSNKQLIEAFGFSQCPHCHRAVTPGAEQEHHQLYHPVCESYVSLFPSH